MAPPLVRSDLDRRFIQAMNAAEGKAMPDGTGILLACKRHPNVPSLVYYRDGVLRLLCPSCGFESMRVKVADG